MEQEKNFILMRIEQFLDKRNWTIYRLAKESDLPYSSLNNIFVRNTVPGFVTLEKICGGLNISLKQFFDDLIYDNEFKRETLPSALKEKLMQTACKHAIKGGDSLDKSEIDALMAKLKGNLALRCPHGRPIAVKITRAEIEKWFKRTV